jgi:hypothetical protein
MVAAALCTMESGTAADKPDYCIVGAYVIGCRSEKTIDRMTSLTGESESLRNMIAEAIVSGECRVFSEGERVYAADAPPRPGLRAVRRADETESWWMPASWSRPVAECPRTTSRSVEQKLGLPPLPPPTTAPAPVPATPTPARRTPPPGSPPCEIKPVMTDAEIAACRR